MREEGHYCFYPKVNEMMDHVVPAVVMPGAQCCADLREDAGNAWIFAQCADHRDGFFASLCDSDKVTRTILFSLFHVYPWEEDTATRNMVWFIVCFDLMPHEVSLW